MSAGNKMLMFAAAVSAGYIVTSMIMSRMGGTAGDEDVTVTVIDERPEERAEIYSAGVDLPPEVLSRMKGEPPKPPEAKAPATTNYNFLITKHGRDQVEYYKQFYSSPAGQKQEDGVTVSNLEQMAREGRMSW